MNYLDKKDFLSAIMSFLTKGKLVYENLLKRSVLKSQFQNSRNLDEKD